MHPLSTRPKWDLKTSKKVSGRSASGKGYSQISQFWAAVQASRSPSRLSPSLQLDSVSTHSYQLRLPSEWRSKLENWAIRCTSGWRLAPRIRALQAPSLSINHKRSWCRSRSKWNQGTTKPHKVSPGKICCLRGIHPSKHDWGTTHVPPNGLWFGGKMTQPNLNSWFSKDASE